MTTTINNEHKELNVPNKREQNQTCLDSAERQGLRPKGNVPNLRFPEFQGEWEKNKLCDVSTIVGRIGFRGYTTQDIVDEGKGAIALSPTNIVNNKLTYEKDNTYISFHKYEESPEIMINQGDVIFVKTGSTVGKVAYVGELICKTTLNPQVVVLKNILCDNYLLSVIMSTQKFQNKIRKITVGGAVPTLSQVAMGKIFISLPKVEEQAKLSKFIALFDERIATQNKIIEDLKKLKCAIIEKLYAEVKGTKYFYRQLFNIINERNKQLEYSNVLSASQEKGMVSRDDLNLDIQFERSNINTYKIVRNGDYVIHLRSFQGGFAFSEKTGVCSPAYTILRPNGLLVYGYLSNYFTSRDFVKSLIIVTYGIRDGRSINVDEWLNMKVIIPSKEQQTHIVNVIESIENKIKNEETYLNCLTNQKQYLLRQMFI